MCLLRRARAGLIDLPEFSVSTMLVLLHAISSCPRSVSCL